MTVFFSLNDEPSTNRKKFSQSSPFALEVMTTSCFASSTYFWISAFFMFSIFALSVSASVSILSTKFTTDSALFFERPMLNVSSPSGDAQAFTKI